MATTAWALPPAPANDEPANAEVISTLPAYIEGTTVLANDSITSIPDLPDITSYVDGPDVYYSLTPSESGTYRIQLWPWHRAPLRSSDRRFSLYVYEPTSVTYVGGVRAPGSGRPVNLDVSLFAGVEYIIGVDHDSASHDNFKFTLAVDMPLGVNPDDCASAYDVTTTGLPIVVLNDIDGAANDFTFTQSGGLCAVSGSSPTTADGIDHVYTFTPAVDGEYAIELISDGFNGVLYIDDSCPPFFFDGCMGASDNSTSGSSGGKHELVVTTLEGGKTYSIFVDDGSTNTSGTYALVIDTAMAYEVSEVEPNDSPMDASSLTTPLNGGQIVGPGDVDWWAIPGLTGARVFAWVNNGGSSNSTLDTDLGFYAADGSTLIEFDDEDADGADAPIEDLRYIYSTSAPVIAGAAFTSDATHYLQVFAQSDTGTVSRYRFHVGVEPSGRAPADECEPNGTFALADRTGKNYFAGVIDVEGDSDFYAIEATAGDRFFVALDGDPERDAAGNVSPSSDPNAFAGTLVLYDPAGDVLISDISDSNSTQATVGPDYPAQAGFFEARTTGLHYVEVRPQSSSNFGPTKTYELAVFLNSAAPALSEDVDPELVLDPDFANDTVAVTTADVDSGICAIDILDNDNMAITNNFTAGDTAAFETVSLVDASTNGSGKLLVTDCAGNTTCEFIFIDVNDPFCEGENFSTRTITSSHGPIHVPDADDAGTNGIIEILEPGFVTDVNVTMSINALDTYDLEVYLISPSGTSVELVTNRGSSSGIDYEKTTFDDSADSIVPVLSSAAPYTGVWLPEDPDGLAKLIGEQIKGTWMLHVIDENSSESFGATLVDWTLDISGTFEGPESFAGHTYDLGDGAGIQSIEITSGTNTEVILPAEFMPGDTDVYYTVQLIDRTSPGTAVVTVTDQSQNTCQSIVALNGAPDEAGPVNVGEVTTSLTFKQEVQQVVPSSDQAGTSATITVPDSFMVQEVEVALMVDAEDQGRTGAYLTHNGALTSLVNRIGMDERQGVGNTKASYDIYLDDDAPADRDIHLEPPLGSQSTLGVYQPDGRGEYALIGEGITSDNRDNMLFAQANQNAMGDWTVTVGDYRLISSQDAIFRRWALTLKAPCGPERYVGTAKDVYPGTGIASIALAGGASNLQVITSFSPGAEMADYRVELVDPFMSGSGTLEIIDGLGNVTSVPISLAAASTDIDAPAVSGSVDAGKFNGTATELEATDGGLASIELSPYAENLQLASVTPDPVAGATSAEFVVSLIDPAANGRGYVLTTDVCGHRTYTLVEIDDLTPICTGEISNTRRFASTDTPLVIPTPGTVTSTITVTDLAVISDVNINFTIDHGYADDIDLSLTSPTLITLFDDIGSTANGFIDTILDDEAAEPIPDSSTEWPFTGSYQPEAGPVLSNLDGAAAAAAYTLNVTDDSSSYYGTLESWALIIESLSYPQRYAGRAEDSAAHDTGICSIVLEPGSEGLVLTTDPYSPGAAIVRYSVELDENEVCGSGTVIVTDCAGNTCETEVTLAPDRKGDMDGDGDVDLTDYTLFEQCLAGPNVAYSGCVCGIADFDDDADVDLADFAAFQVDFD